MKLVVPTAQRHVLLLFRRYGTMIHRLENCVLGNMQGRDPRGALDAVFGGDIIAEVAAKHEPGLQLLLMDVCDNSTSFALPETLRFLFVSNR